MASHKLTYFAMAGSRGEECRLALHLAKIPFDDVRLDRAAWMELKPKTPFGSIPILEIEGKGELAQSNAILRYIGVSHGLLPKDPWESAHHEAVMEAVEELRQRVAPTLRVQDETEKKKLREELVTGFLADWGRHLEKQIKGPFVGGDTLSVADLKVFIAVRWLTSGTVDHIPKTLWSDQRKLIGVHDAAAKHPDIVRWYETKR